MGEEGGVGLRRTEDGEKASLETGKRRIYKTWQPGGKTAPPQAGGGNSVNLSRFFVDFRRS